MIKDKYLNLKGYDFRNGNCIYITQCCPKDSKLEKYRIASITFSKGNHIISGGASTCYLWNFIGNQIVSFEQSRRFSSKAFFFVNASLKDINFPSQLLNSRKKINILGLTVCQFNRPWQHLLLYGYWFWFFPKKNP